MRAFDYLTYAVALFFYLPQLALFWLYWALVFISKPASLYILPALLGGLFYWQYDAIRASFAFDWWLNDVLMRFAPHRRVGNDYWYLGLFWGCFTFALYLLTGGRFQVLGTVLSALPQIRRPFPPRLRLRLAERKIRSARVKIATPRLKRRARARSTPDVTAGLSEPLKRLLAPLRRVPASPSALEGGTGAQAPEIPQTSPPAPPLAVVSSPTPPVPAKAGAEARPSRKPSPPPLPPSGGEDQK